MPAIPQSIPTPPTPPTPPDPPPLPTPAAPSTSSSSPADYTSPGAIAGLVIFGIFFVIFIVGFVVTCINAGACNGECAAVLCCPVIWPFLVARKLCEVAGVTKLYDRTIGPPIRRRDRRIRAARAARNNRATELHNRGYERQKWAREEMQLARKERRVPNLPRSWIAELEASWKKKKSKYFRFHELPAEIRLQIYSYFDYGTALNLMQVSKFFYRDRPEDGIEMEQRAAYLFHAETFARNKDRLACFGCSRMRERVAFEVQRRTGEFERYAERDVERRCFDCQVKGGEIARPRWRRLVRYFKANSKRSWKMKWRR
jgi:hypothetical protein